MQGLPSSHLEADEGEAMILTVEPRSVANTPVRPPMARIALLQDVDCAQAKFCFPLEGKSRAQKEAWIDSHDLFVDDDGRVFALVDTPTRVYFMHSITGSLYQFGECLTSSYLSCHGLLRDRVAARAWLMARRVETLDNDEGVSA